MRWVDKEEMLKIQSEIEADNQGKFTSVSRLHNPHVITTNVQKLFAERNSSRKHLPQKLRLSIISTVECSAFKVKTTGMLQERALSFLDTFIKAITRRGHSVPVDLSDRQLMIFGRVSFNVGIREKTILEEVETNGWKRKEPVGVGKLVVKTGLSQEWYEGKEPLEKQLPKILAYMEAYANDLIRTWDKRKKDEEEAERKLDIERQKQQRKEDELIQFKKLLSEARRWDECKKVRAYIDFIETSQPNVKDLEGVAEWSQWARLKADWYDPQVNAEDDLLTGVDKDSLSFKGHS